MIMETAVLVILCGLLFAVAVLAVVTVARWNRPRRLAPWDETAQWQAESDALRPPGSG